MGQKMAGSKMGQKMTGHKDPQKGGWVCRAGQTRKMLELLTVR